MTAISPPSMPGAGNGSASVPRGFSARNIDRPRWSFEAGSVRTSRGIRAARAACVMQVWAPVTRQTPLLVGTDPASKALGAGAQAAEVAAGFRLGEDGGRDDRAGD